MIGALIKKGLYSLTIDTSVFSIYGLTLIGALIALIGALIALIGALIALIGALIKNVTLSF